MFTFTQWICRGNDRDIKIKVMVRSETNLLKSDFSIRWKVARVKPWRLGTIRRLGGVGRAGGLLGRIWESKGYGER